MFYIRLKKVLLEKWANPSFPLFWWAMWVNRSGRSPKMSDVSKSLRSLTKNERPWANRSGLSPKMSEWANCSFFERIAHSLIFSQKTSDSLRKPISESPALLGILKTLNENNDRCLWNNAWTITNQWSWISVCIIIS